MKDEIQTVEAPAAQAMPNNVRVLVLDDEEQVRNIARLALEGAGCIVETACDGREGLQIMLQRDFDVALVDFLMKDMSGSAFLEEARSLWPWLGIVVMTGHPDPEPLEHARRRGVQRILIKPPKLKDIVRNVLDEAREKRTRLEMSATHSLDRIQGQLTLLRQFSETAVRAESLDEALHKLSGGLGQLLPCVAVGVLNAMEDQFSLHLHTVKPISQKFLSDMEELMLARYEALSGRKCPKDVLRIQADAASPDPSAAQSAGSTFTLPVVIGGAVTGLLTLAAVGPDDFTTADAAFLYHAANHLSTIVMSLNRMRQLAVRDALTGLYNRRGLEEEFARAWLMSRRYSFPMGVAVIDVDHFKKLNDTYGHLNGDQILKEFARLVEKVARGTDIIGRYGGDEIVVVLPQAGAADAIAFGERLLNAVRRHVFCDKFSLTVSIGVASSTTSPAETSGSELFALADQALYEAKRKGRDRLCIQQEATAAAPAPSPADRPAESRDEKSRGRIMIVDDEVSVGRVLRRILEGGNYRVTVETSAQRALDHLCSNPGQYDVVLTDLNLPEKSGLELLDELRSIDESLAKIVITGHATMDNAITCLRRGAYDFIEKPVVPNQLLAVLERALEYRRLKAENKLYQNHLEDMVREKSTALREALDLIKRSYEFTLEALVAMLDAREKNTGQHSLRVRDLSVTLCRHMGLSQSERDDIAQGALLHDIGKISVPDSILLKAGPLTAEERSIMESHAEVGYRILSSSSYLERAAEIVYSHQEWWDGRGYPRGLKGEEICLGARIFAVVDAYDAMRSDRVYRKSMPPAAARSEIVRMGGMQFDPMVVQAFLRCQEELEAVGGWSAGKTA
jgi:diguanylate cyclase (GGDEF)-like protein/putative nucleotidyltransferase with HDIG domain